jgi:inosose dehydratase
MATRRHFLRNLSVGAAACAAVTSNNIAAIMADDAASSAPSASSASKSSEHAKATLEFGIASYSFRKFSLDQTLAMTSRLGIKHVCLKSSHLPLSASPELIAETLRKAKDAGIDIYGVGVIYMSKPEEVNQAFEYAKAANVRVIVGVPAVGLLPLVNEKVKQYDIRVAIHNHGPGDKNYPRAADAYEKIQSLDRRIGLCVDVGHSARSGDDPSRIIEQYADRIYDVHMKDEFAASKEGDTIEMGRGVMDIPKLVCALVKIKYADIVSFEFDTDHPEDPLPGLAESVGYVRGVLAAL